MTKTEIEPLIRERLGEPVVEVKDVTDDGGYGLVRYVLPGYGDSEHIVHRWATKDTAGDPIPFRLYSGGYYFDDEEAEAIADFRERAKVPA